MTAAGFINGSYTMATSTTSVSIDTNTPKNPYSVYVQLTYDNVYGTGTGPLKHNLKTGSQIPVEIMAEIDRKIDDGLPYAGGFQYSTFVPPPGAALVPTDCVNTGATPPTWNIAGQSTNCGGASLF